MIKQSRNAPHSANRTEWEVWQELVSSPFSEIFAECRALSVGGRYLVMERLNPDVEGRDRPATPVWLTDRKPSCLGVAADGKIKVLDYGQSGPWDDGRAKAPTHPWPSQSQTAAMGALASKLGDDPWGLKDG